MTMTHFTDCTADSFCSDVIAGLSLPRKRLAPKYFYDAEGSRLFRGQCAARNGGFEIGFAIHA